MSKPDLELVLGHYGVRVRPRHGDQMVTCPVHGDSKPSLSVNLDKGVANCFGCDWGGSGADLIMAMEGLSFRQSLEFAEREGLLDGSAGTQEQRSPGGQLIKRSKRKTRKPFLPPWR